jgi:integrase
MYVKPGQDQTGFFERDQFEGVVSHLPGRLKPVVRFAYITGWRRSEIVNLRWRQVDFAGRGSVRLETGTTKNGRGREIPMVRDLRTVLEEQRVSADAIQKKTGQIIPWVFFYTEGKRVGNRVGDFRKTWGVACMKAGLPVTIVYKRDQRGEIVLLKRGPKQGQPMIEKVKADSVLHDFRRTAVRNLERSGIPRKVAMQLTGHLTESVYQRYDIVSESDLLIAAEKLDGHGLGTVQPTLNDLQASLSAATSS